MTPNTRRALALIAAAAPFLAAPAGQASVLLPPPGPWPAPVIGATNPLTGTPWLFNGGYATPNASLRVWLPYGRSRRAAITRVIGGKTVVRGRLRNRDNRRSISGALVQLAAQPVHATNWYLAAVARTNRKGRFRAVLPGGPTRRVAVLYWPLASSPAPVFSRRLLVRAKARVYLTARMLHGRRIVYRGRVSGAPIPPGGLVVAAQVKNGRSWVTVRLVRTMPSGRFGARYRFAYAGRRYRVRALVPSQPAWPLYTGHSTSQRLTSR